MLHTLNSNGYRLVVMRRLFYLQSITLRSVPHRWLKVPYWLPPGDDLGIVLAVWYTYIEWYESLLFVLVYGWLQSVSSQWELIINWQQAYLHMTNESCSLNGRVSLERSASWVVVWLLAAPPSVEEIQKRGDRDLNFIIPARNLDVVLYDGGITSIP